MLSLERQSAQMSIITNHGLTQSGTRYPYGNSGRQRVKPGDDKVVEMCVVGC